MDKTIGFILLLLVVAGCSSKKDITVSSPADRYVESVNKVSGTFTIDASFNYDKKPSTVNVTQAYARVPKNQADQSKRDVLIMLLEKPLSRHALAVAENDDVADEVWSRLTASCVRAVTEGAIAPEELLTVRDLLRRRGRTHRIVRGALGSATRSLGSLRRSCGRRVLRRR